MNKKWYEIISEMNGTLLSLLIHILFMELCNGLLQQLRADYGTLVIVTLISLSYLLCMIVINVSVHWFKKQKAIKEV